MRPFSNFIARQNWRQHLLATAVAFVVLNLFAVVKASTSTPSSLPVNELAWQRDFSTPLEEDESFLIVGFTADRGDLSPTLQRSVDGGILTVSDPRSPGEGGSFTVVGVDAASVFEDVRVTGTINVAGIPEPPPRMGSGPEWENEIGIGLLARGNFASGSAYAGGIDFLTGEPFVLLLMNRMIYPVDSARGESLADEFPDFMSRSFYLQFEVRSKTVDLGFGNGPQDIVNLHLNVYDEPGGALLREVDWNSYSALLDSGLAGVFASFRYADAPEYYPPLFASFDDVAATVPEPRGEVLVAAALIAGIAMLRSDRMLRLKLLPVVGMFACLLAMNSPTFATTTTTTTPPPPTSTTTDPPSPPPIPVATSGGWFRDFNGPLDDNFLALGFKFRGGYYESDGQLAVAPTFQRGTEGGVLKLWDETPPSAEGAHTALAADFSMAFDKVRMSGTINPLGLPPIPDGSPITGENSLGFIARGDLLTMSTYYAAIDFRDGRLRIGNVFNGQVYFADHRVSLGETLAEMFADYKSRSYFLEFDVETYAGGGSGAATLPAAFEFAENGDVMLSARIFDQRGGNLLISLDWLDDNRKIHSPGVSGVFVQSFAETWQNAELHPALFGSFDDVSAVVPEPATWLLAVVGGGGLFVAARRRRRNPRR